MPSRLIPLTRCNLLAFWKLAVDTKLPDISPYLDVPSNHFSVPADVKYPISYLLLHW